MASAEEAVGLAGSQDVANSSAEGAPSPQKKRGAWVGAARAPLEPYTRAYARWGVDVCLDTSFGPAIILTDKSKKHIKFWTENGMK